MLHQFYHLIPDKASLCRIFEGSYANPDFRSGCNFVPYTESELAEIAAYDQKEGRNWSPPVPACLSLEELCQRLRAEAEEEAIATEATQG